MDATQAPAPAAPADDAPSNPLGLSQDQATRLRDAGHLPDELYGRLYPSPSAAPGGFPSAVPPSGDLAFGSPFGPTGAADAPRTEAIAQVDPDDANRQRMRDMEAERQAALAHAEQKQRERHAADAAQEVESKRRMAISMGVPSGEIESRLAPDVARAQGLAEDARLGASRAGASQLTSAAAPAGGAGAAAAPKLAIDSEGGIAGDTSGVTGNAGVNQLLAGMKPDYSGYGTAMAGINQGIKAAEAKAKEQAAAIDVAQAKDKDRIEADEVRRVAQDAHLKRQMDTLHQKADEIGATKLDAHRLWNNRSTGDKVLAGIGLFLGAFGSGGNKAVDVINTAINKDIDAQKTDIQSKKDAYSAQAGIYRDMLSTFKDENAAREATRVAYLKNAETQVAGITARYSGAEAKAKGTELIGKLQQERANAQNAFAQAMLPRVLEMMQPNNPEFMDKDKRERFVPGYGLALSKEDSSKFKDHLAEAEGTKGNLKRLLAIARTPGKTSDLDLRNEAQTLATIVQSQLRTPIVGPGAVQDREWDILKSIVADPTAVWSLDASSIKRLETVMGFIDRQTAAKAQVAGLVSATKKLGFTKDQ